VIFLFRHQKSLRLTPWAFFMRDSKPARSASEEKQIPRWRFALVWTYQFCPRAVYYLPEIPFAA
jgi:hypothetical protein